MKKRVVSILLCVAMTAAMVAGCGSSSDGGSSSDSGEDSGSGDVITVGFSQVGAESDWRTANTESMQETFTE